MKYYLKKCWPTVTAASICMVVAYGLQVCTSLVQIQITQGLLDGDLPGFHHSDHSSSADLAGRGPLPDCRDLLPGPGRAPDEQRSAPGYGSGPVAQDPSGVS